MRILVSGTAIMIAAAIWAQAASADPIGWQEIPGKVAGSWIAPGGKCDAPSLIVTAAGGKEFLFSFRAPTQRELHLKEGVPAPQVVGAPPAAAFQSTVANDKLWLEVSMANADILRVNFMSVDDPTTTYTRCDRIVVS